MTVKGAMKVLIMDDSAIVRKRLTAMLSKIVEEENISYAEDATEAINSIQKLNPDALITGYADAWRKRNRSAPGNEEKRSNSSYPSSYRLPLSSIPETVCRHWGGFLF